MFALTIGIFGDHWVGAILGFIVYIGYRALAWARRHRKAAPPMPRDASAPGNSPMSNALSGRSQANPNYNPEEWRRSPEDRADPAGWDCYWEERVKRPEPHDIFFYFEILAILVPALRARGLRRVLCAGNGVSLEPLALAVCGFEVTAVDLSAKAMDFMRGFTLTEEHLQRFDLTGARMPDGSVQFLQGDLRDERLCPGPYDVIITRRTLQLLPEQERWLALESLERRLVEGGLFVSHDHNNPRATEPWFRGREYDFAGGFAEGSVRRREGGALLSARPGRRTAWILRSSG